ncbi:MAG: DUF5671 domain-containing protein [Pseudomonadota bacterium]
MGTRDELKGFVRDALVAGRSRAEIADALSAAGWGRGEIETALSDFSDTPFIPPVPRPRGSVTARDTFLYAILFTALLFASGYLIALVHSLLDIWLPDAADSEYVRRGAESSIRWAIAVLIVSVPVYVWLSIVTDRRAGSDPGHARSPVRKWLTYLALFICALVIFADLTYVIYALLNGEFTLRFILKAGAIAVIAGLIFLHYLRTVEGKHEGA